MSTDARAARAMHDSRRGILFVIAAMATFAVMDSTAKHLTQTYSPMQVAWARYTSHTIVVFAVLAPRLGTLLKTSHLRWQIVRSALLFGATLAFFTALSGIGLAEAVAIFEVNPLIVTALAFLFLGEKVGLLRIAGVLLGLAGALIIIRPGTAVFSPYAVLPLIAATCYAAYVVTTRFLGRDDGALTSLAYTAIVGTFAASLLVPFFWQTPTPFDALLMLLMGVIGGTGHFFLIRGFTLAEAGLLAPFSYVGLIFATFAGYLIFAEFPDGPTLFGALVIVVSGLYVWRREQFAKASKA